MISGGYDKDWGDWILFEGVSCPCVGKYVQVHFGYGDIEEGIANDHIYWAYVHAYRVRREVEDDGGMGYNHTPEKEGVK